MKAKELIAELEKLDGEMEVLIRKTNPCGRDGDINSVITQNVGRGDKTHICIILTDKYPTK